ncbi:patatin-like phospholipase family protein [Sphingomonas sp. BIUV-7]|uniref:Patatin-like phospholipase family protein n=1 Tax=Sphingomonas natans TaxID=3063330 RepID=A0ABT8YAZ8_9SPHN|nr:patatin-like phospholipase family protein [Sphingomonas sp. BIUV-7]MDO6415491.1 patatin-like phospholipase family protein [Sphingomonas sp. BIUV-7]
MRSQPAGQSPTPVSPAKDPAPQAPASPATARKPRPPARAPAAKAKSNGTPFESVALLLQGGGALGSYQAGVYEALCEHNIDPSWVAGISIGAINSAIIAGNAPKERVAKLRAFWELVSTPITTLSSFLPKFLHEGQSRGVINQLAAAGVMTKGVQGFFEPRVPPPFAQPAANGAATSWYDTAPLKATLESLVDFDRINHKDAMRFSVGAVNVETANFAYFDNATDTIIPEHIMASGALPPAFAAVEIDGQFYWDGGLVSNTPLSWVLSAHSDLDTLVFQVDLWSASGQMPTDLAGVATRIKDIQFSSRTRAATKEFAVGQELRAAYRQLMKDMPAELAATPAAKRLAAASDPAVYNIVQLIYKSPGYEQQSKDYEFSRWTMEDHWRTGYENAITSLSHPEVLTLPPELPGLAVYDFVSKPEPRSA